MSYPDTMRSCLERTLDRLRQGADLLATEAAELHDDQERRDFRLAAERSARRYAEALAAQLDADQADAQILQCAELVARATELAGWLSADVVDAIPGEKSVMMKLTEQGFFAYYPREPGRWRACYRLVSP